MLKDFIYVQSEAFIKTAKMFKHLPILILHFIAYDLIYTLAVAILSLLPFNTGFIGGLILYMIKGMIFSHLLYTLDSIVNSNRIYYKYLKEGFFRYLSPAISAFFMYYIIELILRLIIGTNKNLMVLLLLNILIFLIFSAVAECIYIAKAYRYDSIFMGVNIIFENPLNWTLVHLVIYGLGYYLGLSPNIFQVFPGVLNMSNIYFMLLSTLFLSVYMVYKGNLFKLIYNSSMRKRQYMRQ
ncbi:MAG: hypothetical protein Q4P34_05330 [Tissierellia bacterium]|nr:hypothetical protein [Tissierellia bacterium]